MLDKPKIDCYFWQDQNCQFPHNHSNCKYICKYYVQTTDQLINDIPIITYVVNMSIAKETYIVCCLTLIVALLTLIVAVLTIAK